MASREMQGTRGSFKVRPAQLGAALAFIGVALGAFGAHSLGDVLTPDRLATFETGVRYQIYHALGLLAIGALPVRAAPGPRSLSLSAASSFQVASTSSS